MNIKEIALKVQDLKNELSEMEFNIASTLTLASCVNKEDRERLINEAIELANQWAEGQYDYEDLTGTFTQ